MADRGNTSKVYLQPGQNLTAIAAAAITGSRFVKLAAGGVGNRPKVTPCSVLGERNYGVAFADAASADAIYVVREGVVGVLANATITSGQPVTTDAAGRAVVATIGTHFVIGYATADTASGALVPVDLNARG